MVFCRDYTIEKSFIDIWLCIRVKYSSFTTSCKQRRKILPMVGCDDARPYGMKGIYLTKNSYFLLYCIAVNAFCWLFHAFFLDRNYITKTHFIWQARWLLMPDSYLHLEFNVLPLKNGMLLTFSLPKSYFEVQLAVALIDKGLSYFYWIDFIAQFRAEIPHSRRCQVACQDSVWLLPRRFVCFDQSSFYGPLQPEVVYCLLQRCVAALAR